MCGIVGSLELKATSINVYKLDHIGREIDIYCAALLHHGTAWLWLEATLLRLLGIFLEQANVIVGKSALVRAHQHARQLVDD